MREDRQECEAGVVQRGSATKNMNVTRSLVFSQKQFRSPNLRNQMRLKKHQFQQVQQTQREGEHCWSQLEEQREEQERMQLKQREERLRLELEEKLQLAREAQLQLDRVAQLQLDRVARFQQEREEKIKKYVAKDDSLYPVKSTTGSSCQDKAKQQQVQKQRETAQKLKTFQFSMDSVRTLWIGVLLCSNLLSLLSLTHTHSELQKNYEDLEFLGLPLDILKKMQNISSSSSLGVNQSSTLQGTIPKPVEQQKQQLWNRQLQSFDESVSASREGGSISDGEGLRGGVGGMGMAGSGRRMAVSGINGFTPDAFRAAPPITLLSATKEENSSAEAGQQFPPPQQQQQQQIQQLNNLRIQNQQRDEVGAAAASQGYVGGQDTSSGYGGSMADARGAPQGDASFTTNSRASGQESKSSGERFAGNDGFASVVRAIPQESKFAAPAVGNMDDSTTPAVSSQKRESGTAKKRQVEQEEKYAALADQFQQKAQRQANQTTTQKKPGNQQQEHTVAVAPKKGDSGKEGKRKAEKKENNTTPANQLHQKKQMPQQQQNEKEPGKQQQEHIVAVAPKKGDSGKEGKRKAEKKENNTTPANQFPQKKQMAQQQQNEKKPGKQHVAAAPPKSKGSIANRASKDNRVIGTDVGMSACLVVMDDNHWLTEWLAYHYYVLPLKYVMVFHDPRSKTSPLEIFDRWRGRLDIEIVTDDQQLMMQMDKHTDPNQRKRLFYRHCTETLLKRRSDAIAADEQSDDDWVVLVDTNEYIRPNPYLTDSLSPLPPMVEPGTVSKTIQMYETASTNQQKRACFNVPRVQITNQDSVPLHTKQNTYWGQQKLVSTTHFLTTRWFYHSGEAQPVEDGQGGIGGKFILNLARMQESDILFQSPDFPGPIFPSICSSQVDLLHPQPSSAASASSPVLSPLMINNYLGTLEQYTYRDDPRNGNNTKHVDVWNTAGKQPGTKEDKTIVRWLQGFIKHVGQKESKRLLHNVGVLEDTQGRTFPTLTQESASR